MLIAKSPGNIRLCIFLFVSLLHIQVSDNTKFASTTFH